MWWIGLSEYSTAELESRVLSRSLEDLSRDPSLGGFHNQTDLRDVEQHDAAGVSHKEPQRAG